MNHQRLNAVIAAIVPLACATSGPRPPAAPLMGWPPPPAECEQLVQVRTVTPGRFGRGWATPPSPTHLLTAAHIVGQGVITWVGPGAQEGRATVLWQNEERDLAMFVTDRPLLFWLTVARHAPRVGEWVYYRGYLAAGKPACIAGLFLGVDGEGDAIVWGWYHPGMSGGGVLDGRGQVFAVASRGGNWASTIPMDVQLEVTDVLELLERRSYFPPAMVATPVFGGWPKPRGR